MRVAIQRNIRVNSGNSKYLQAKHCKRRPISAYMLMGRRSV